MSPGEELTCDYIARHERLAVFSYIRSMEWLFRFGEDLCLGSVYAEVKVNSRRGWIFCCGTGGTFFQA